MPRDNTAPDSPSDARTELQMSGWEIAAFVILMLAVPVTPFVLPFLPMRAFWLVATGVCLALIAVSFVAGLRWESTRYNGQVRDITRIAAFIPVATFIMYAFLAGIGGHPVPQPLRWLPLGLVWASLYVPFFLARAISRRHHANP